MVPDLSLLFGGVPSSSAIASARMIISPGNPTGKRNDTDFSARTKKESRTAKDGYQLEQFLGLRKKARRHRPQWQKMRRGGSSFRT